MLLKGALMTTSEFESRVTALEKTVAELQEQLECSQMLGGIKRGLNAADAGRMSPARDALENLRQKQNIARV